jgi:hypothetical protein
MSLALELVQGTARDFPLQVNNADGTPATNFVNSDTLSTTVWLGENQSPLVSPTTTWLFGDATQGQILITFQDADTASLTPGVYYIQAFATRAGSPSRTTALLPRGSSIEILGVASTETAAAVVTATIVGQQITGYVVVSGGAGYPASSTTIPVTITGGGGYSALALATSNSSGVVTAVNPVAFGTGYSSQPTITVGVAVPPVYCTLQDMQDQCAWIQQYMDTEHEQTGFLAQRARARVWLDNLILSSWPGARVTYIQDGWPSNYGQFTLIANPWLVAGLASGYLMLTGPRGLQVVECCALYSLALVLRSQMGPTSGIEAYAGYFMRRAQAAASMLTAELDINGDGIADIAVPLGITNTRRG